METVRRENLHPYMDKVVYEIYPKSFMDSNGDGSGDIKGITSKLDYLKDLGVDLLWLAPVYPTPYCDNGYDVADYKAINPDFGTMEDFEELIAEADKRGMGIMMDMVFNHTSDEHEWFKKALAGDEEYKQYYIFKDPVDGHEPTNWQSKFGGSAWQYVPELNQYYLHVFAIKQPDLNWDNPKVRQECADIINFWREKGVKGFRFDVINLISKAGYADDEIWDGRRFYTDGPRIHEFLQGLNSASFGQDDSIITVGEMNSTNLESTRQYASLNRKELDMAFSFHHLKVDYEDNGRSKEKWVLRDPDIAMLRDILFEWQLGMQESGSWNAVFLNCHDQPRSLSRFGDEGKYRKESAKTLGMLIHMLRGTPYIYQGEELGMKNPGFTSLSQYRDVESINAWGIMEGRGLNEGERIAILAQKSRDNARTPMNWDAQEENGGFGKGTPWIEYAKDDAAYCAKAEVGDPDSVFSFYKALIAARKEHSAISVGEFIPMDLHNAGIIAWKRKSEDEEAIVICNLNKTEASIVLENEEISGYEPVLSSVQNPQRIAEKMTLAPFESMVYLRKTA